jgi:2-polyprenyl-3-methyl-5-hydroxy-6-metoxy-1,4-benzoquinol methylase
MNAMKSYGKRNDEPVVCPLCAEPGEKIWLAKATLNAGVEHDLLACFSCGLIFMHPIPDVRSLQSFYSPSYFAEFDRVKLEGRGRAFARRYLRRLQPGRFLDVGCAIGAFMQGIRKASGWDVHGVDIGINAIEFAREKYKFDARPLQLTEAGFPPAFFDFIHINNVLEHVTNPLIFMNECRRILKPGGQMYLSVPNGANDSRNLIRFWQEEHTAPCSKEGHLFFFPPQALYELFKRSGFLILKARSYGFNRGLRNCGLLPHKKNWKRAYTPQPLNAVENPPIFLHVREGYSYPEWYYRFRLWKSSWGIPGLHSFCLDFLFFLQPN